MTETRTTTPATEAETTTDETAERSAETTDSARAQTETTQAGALRTNPTPTPAEARRTDPPAAPAGGSEAALFGEADAKDLQGRWQAIQVGFVDEPRGAVQQADQLVDEVMRRLAESFARERQELERAWSGGDEASTEDLRQAIRRYRSFFNRLLSL